MALSSEERRALHVLGYLLLRMGLYDRAGRVYAALVADPDQVDRLAHAGLAATELERGEGRTALEQLHAAMSGGALSSRQAALHLMKARALWMEGRKDEARAAVDEYLYLAGNEEKA